MCRLSDGRYTQPFRSQSSQLHGKSGCESSAAQCSKWERGKWRIAEGKCKADQSHFEYGGGDLECYGV